MKSENKISLGNRINFTYLIYNYFSGYVNKEKVSHSNSGRPKR